MINYSTSIEAIVENRKHTGRFKVMPKKKKDLGTYECYPRYSAGSVTFLIFFLF